MFIVATFALFSLSLEQKGTIDDDVLAGTKTRENFHFAAKIATAADASNLEMVCASREKHAPLVANALNGCNGDCEDSRAALTDWQCCGRRHAGTQEIVAVLDVDPDGHGARLTLDMASDHRDGAGEVLARKRRKRQARRDAPADANGVALECVNGEPECGEVADAKRWCLWIQHLPDNREPLDHRARHRTPQYEDRRGRTVAVIRGRVDAECGDRRT